MPKRFPDARAIIGAISRGLSAFTTPAGTAMPLAGVDQGDGTVALLVSTATGGGSAGLFTLQTTVIGGATAVQISNPTPNANRSSVLVTNAGSPTNTGTPTMWLGNAGVTNLTGFPVYTGQEQPFALNSSVPLYAYASATTVAAVAEL